MREWKGVKTPPSPLYISLVAILNTHQIFHFLERYLGAHLHFQTQKLPKVHKPLSTMVSTPLTEGLICYMLIAKWTVLMNKFYYWNKIRPGALRFASTRGGTAESGYVLSDADKRKIERFFTKLSNGVRGK